MNYYVFTYSTNYGMKTTIIKARTEEIAKSIAESDNCSVWPNYQVDKLSNMSEDKGTGVVYDLCKF